MARKPADPLSQSLGSSSLGSARRPLRGSDMLKFYMEDIDTTTRKLELEQRRLHKLNKDLATADSEYSQKRGHAHPQKKEGRPNANDTTRKGGLSQDAAARTRGQEVRQLEKRLEKAISDLNQSTNGNEQLMKQIDQLRKERQVLDNVFQGMTRSISRKRAEGEKLRGLIHAEAQQSEEAKQRQNALGKMLKKDRDKFQDDRHRMNREVQEQHRVKKEQAISSHPGDRNRAAWARRAAPGGPGAQETSLAERDEQAQEAEEGEQSGPKKKPAIAYLPGAGKSKDGGSYTIADEEEEFSEQSMHRRILKLSFLNTIQRRHIKSYQNQIEVFEQAFNTIRSSTQIHEIDEIVRIFVELEQRNFSLLTYVNQLNREIEAIDIRKRELQTALDTHDQDEVNSKHRKEVLLKDVNAQIDKTKQAVAEKDKMIEDACKALEDCRPPIWKTVMYLKKELPRLAKSGYDGDAPPMKQLPPHEDDEPLNHQLAYIEEAILQFRASLGEGAVGRARPMPAAKAQPPPGHKKPVELPSAQNINDDSDEEGDQPGLGDRPMDLQELRKRALEKEMSKKKKQRSGPQGRQAHAQDQGADEEETPDAMARGQKRETALTTPKDPGGEAALGGPGTLSKSPSVGKPPLETPKEPPGDASVDFLRKEMWWREKGDTVPRRLAEA